MGKEFRDIFRKMIILTLALVITGTGLLGNMIIGADSVFDNRAYAEEDKKETEDGKEDEGEDDSTLGSSGNNLMNVLSQSRTSDGVYMTNLNHVMEYDKRTHYLMTLSVLNSEVMAPGEYAKVYSGGYKPEGLPDDFSDLDTNGSGLYDRLDRIELDTKEDVKKEGISDSVVETIFGKKRSELSKDEKDTLSILQEIAEGEDEDKYYKDFQEKAVTNGGQYLCDTAYTGSGYGGAGFSVPVASGDEEVEQGEFIYTHNVEVADLDNITSKEEYKDICVENIEKFYDAGKDQTGSMVQSIESVLIDNGGEYTSELAESAINSLVESKGTLSGAYADINKTVDTASGASDVIGNIKTDNLLVNYGLWLAEMYSSILEKIGVIDTVNSNVHYILGYGTDEEDKYSNVASDTRTDMANTLIPTINDVYGTDYTKEDFDITGEKGDYKFNKQAYEDLNKTTTINLITSAKYFNNKNSATKDAYLKARYSKLIEPLAEHPYIIFSRYSDEILGSDVHNSVKDIKGLGWVPLYFKNEFKDGIGTTSESRYKTLMDENDGTTKTDEGRFLQNEDGPRVLKVRDIVADESGKGSYSPLSAYSIEDEGYPFDSGVGRQDEFVYNPSSYSGLKLENGEVNPRGDDHLEGEGAKKVYQEAFSDSGIKKAYTGEEAMGVDNYGNLIVGNGLSIAVPYWHFLDIEGDIYSTPLYKGDASLDVEGSNFIDTQSSNGENDYAFHKRKNDLNTAYANVSINSVDGIKVAISEGRDYEADLRRLAYRIVEHTEDVVKEHNEKFLESYDKTQYSGDGELYLTSAQVNENGTTEMDKLQDEFTEADIIHKIAMMLKYGASDFIRLTFVGFFVDFYNTTVYNFNISEVFYSTTIVDSGFFKGILPNITILIGAVTALYWGYSVFNMWRGRITAKRFVGVTVGLTFVLVMPFLYAILMDVGMNKVSDKMLGKQTRQMMVVDSWTRNIEKEAQSNSASSRLYGNGKDIEFRDSGQDYILTFATTTAIENGCDVVEPKEPYCEEFAYKQNSDELKTNWKQSDLVTVNVSMYDVLDWLGNIDDGIEEDLFEYLEGRDDASEKGYDGLDEYTEYSVNTSVLLKDIGIGQNVFSGEVISASELLKRVYVNANKGDELVDTLGGLSVVYDELLKNPEVTNEEVKYVVRDISMTRKSREALNLGSDVLSPVSENVSQRANIGLEVPGKDMEDHSGDLFNLYDSIEKLDPYRVPGYKKELEEDVYRLNKETIENYFTDFAMVGQIMGDDPSYKRTEADIMTMVLWFNINDYFGFELFPQEYDGSSISLDNYMRVAYIPIGVFSDPTVSASGEYGYTNVGEYLSLRENMFNLLMFAISILFMIGYGLIKWAVIYFVLLALTIYGFFKNYIFQYNPDNKFGFGALVVYGTFIVINIIFNTMWWIFGYALNNSYVGNDGAVGYPAVVVHSVVTIFVLAFIIFFVFKKLFKNVRGDLDNMGGSNFKKDFDNMRGRMKGMMNGVMRSSENTKPSAYMEESSREGGEGAITKDEVKRSNDEGERNLKTVINDDSVTTSQFIMSELDNSNQVVNNPDSAYAKMRGIINPRKTKGIALANTLKDFDSIDTSANGLISEEDRERYDALGSYGTKISESGTGNSVSVIGLGSSAKGVEQAKLLNEYLNNKGVKSTVDDKGQVMFDSGKYNMNTPAGRKTLLGGFVKSVADNVANSKTTERMEVDNNSLLNNNFDYTVGDKGLVSVGVGGASGIHPSVLAEMLTQDWFKDRFRVEKAYNGKGGEGEIVIEPKAKNAEESDKYLSELFKEDSKIRDREGMEERKDDTKNNNILKFNGSNPEVLDMVKKEYESIGGASSGAKLHSNAIVFNKSDMEHRKLVKQVEKGVKDKYNNDAQTAEQIATKVGSFVVQGQGTNDEEEMNVFQRMTQRTKDARGNVMFNINNAQTEAKEKVMGMATLSGLSAKSKEGVEKQSKSSKEDLRGMENMTEEELDNLAKSKSNFKKSFGARNTVTADKGNQRHTKVKTSTKSAGAGLMFGKVDTSDAKVREQLTKSGILGGKVETTSFGSEGFDKKVEIFNKVTKVVEENKEDIKHLSESKDKLKDVVNNRIGRPGSEKRAKELITYISNNNSDPDLYRSVQRMYDKLNEDYNSGNIEDRKYKHGLKEITGKVENMLKDQNKYDSALIHMANKEKDKMTDVERQAMSEYRKYKSKLVEKNVDAKTIEKLDGKIYNKMMAFVEQGNKVTVNEDDKRTFSIHSDEKLSNSDTQELYRMINDIA